MPIVVMIAVSLYIAPFGLINGELYDWIVVWWNLSFCHNYCPNKSILLLYLFFVLAFSLLFSINPISKTFIRSNNRYKKNYLGIAIHALFTGIVTAISFLIFKIKTPMVFSFFIPMSILISNGIIIGKRK